MYRGISNVYFANDRRICLTKDRVRQHTLILNKPTNSRLEKVAINDALPLTAARHDTIARSKSFWRFESDKPNVVSIKFSTGRLVDAA